MIWTGATPVIPGRVTLWARQAWAPPSAYRAAARLVVVLFGDIGEGKLSVAVAGALAAPALAVETSDFNLATTRDLVALCSCQPDEPLYAEAQQ